MGRLTRYHADTAPGRTGVSGRPTLGGKRVLGRKAVLCGKPAASAMIAVIVALAVVLAVPASTLAVGQQAFAADQSLEVSAEGTTARLSSCAFAVEGFSRAQKGSSRLIDGEYHGYTYVLDGPGGLTAIATSDAVVVYVPAQAAQAVGLNLQDPSDQESLKKLLIALDAPAAKGARSLSPGLDWRFTDERRYALGDIVFSFDQELRKGEFYACVAAADGSDITDPKNPLFTDVSHADFARLVKAADAVVVAPKEGIDAFVDFLVTMDYSPLWVTLKTTGTAIVIIFILGLAAAYFSLRIPSRAQDVADSIFTIPMVLPPTVCGFLLLLLFGRNTGIGQWFIDIGFPLIFSWQATVLAAVVVAFPLMYRSARGAFEGLDANMLDAARTLGWSNGRIFFRLMLPLAWSSIAAGTVLAFARALGEFGATLFLAGNYLGVTRTIPIAMYFEWMNGKNEVAIFWTVVIIIISFIVILFINLWSKRTTTYRRPAKSTKGTKGIKAAKAAKAAQSTERKQPQKED